jgi:hypothetical protein
VAYLLISINSYLIENDIEGKYERQSVILMTTCFFLIGAEIKSAFTAPDKKARDEKSPKPEVEQTASADRQVKNI